MSDRILQSFVERQRQDLADLDARSDVLQTFPLEEGVPGFLVALRCTHAIGHGGAVRVVTDWCRFGIQLPSDYLRYDHPDSSRILALLAPAEVYHPNVAWPFICTGPVAAGTPVRQLILRVYDILTYNRLNPREHDSLNRNACQWARANLDRFPLERRPLIRPAASQEVRP